MKRLSLVGLVGACALAVLLWFPTVDLPVVSDSALYALLGESFWTEGQYAVLGELHRKHMPLHAVTAYPLVAAFGYSLGMKLATLLAGIGVLIAAYFLLKRTMGERAAYWGVILISLHHGFAVMTQLGSADLLLTLFFLLTLHAYLSAERGLRWYLAMGLFLGLACLTRYNALPLFLFLPLYTFWKLRNHLRSPWFIGGMLLAAALASLWFLRNIAVFGTLENDYTGELSIKSAGIFRQFFINASYYLDPLKNILPVLLPFAVYGAWRARKEQTFLITMMIGIWSLFAVWPVLNVRYAFPGYIVLLGFAVYGIFETSRFFGRFRPLFTGAVISLALIADAGALCLYASGSCNAWFDRTVDRIPKNLGLATEGFYTWDLARDWVNLHAEKGAIVRAQGDVNARMFAGGIFRDDLQIVSYDAERCPVYTIVQQLVDGANVVFETDDEPKTYVLKEECNGM
ncbi:MAG: glycosyltransferase family 39 protein [Patescibacteria group bacterium]